MKPKTLINAGRLAEKIGQTGLARGLYARSTKGAGAQRAEALYRLANLGFHAGDISDVQQLLEDAIELQPDRAAWRYRLGTVLEKQGNNDGALHHYRAAVALEPENVAWARRLERCQSNVRMSKAQSDDERAKLLRRKGERWRELEVLQASAPNFRKSPDWFLRLGDTLEEMNRFQDAAVAFEQANRLRPGRPENLFREGHCWKKAGFPERAEAIFLRTREADVKFHSKELGVGVFYERRGMWHEAAAQFEKDSDKRPLTAELQFRAGRALERSYFWKEAVYRYSQATLLNPSETRYHFRLGYAYERIEDFAAAEDCYSYGIDLLSPNDSVARYWSFRLGVVREAQGDHEKAISAYSASLNTPAVSPEASPKVGETAVSQRQDYGLALLRNSKALALRSGDANFILTVAGRFERRELWQDAADCLKAAADRSHSFNQAIFMRLGQAYAKIGDITAASDTLRMTRISTAPRGIDSAKYKKDVNLQALFEYAEMMENLPVREDVILYESFFGKQITCNPYALFTELLADPKYKDYTHVWSVARDVHIPLWMRNMDNVVFAPRGSHLNRRYLATAKYLVNNVTFPPFFVRRPEQRYLNTWHGTPMKTLGKDVGTGILEHRNVSRNLLQATHILTPNEHTTNVLLERSDVLSLVTAKVGYTGYPRTDLTVNMDGHRRADILRALGIATNDPRRIVLYAPTWRGGTTSQHFDTDRLSTDLGALAELDCLVLFQGHHLSVSLLPADLPVHMVNEEINVNELLAVVDVLITDYSSIMFDFFATGRPVICYTYDLEDYIAERGLYFTPAQLGLIEVHSSRDLVASVTDALSAPAEFIAPVELVNRFCAREDGKAAKRVAAFFLEEDNECNIQLSSPGKRKYLFHHSMLPNGISSSLTNLLKSLDPERCDVTVVVPAGAVEKDEGRANVLKGLPSFVKVLGDAGRQVANIEEKWLIDYLNRWHVLPSDEQHDLYMGAFRREYRRLFGDTEFDVIVEFEGYSRYWTSVLAAGSVNARKLIYLHSDMEAEWKMKFPYLRTVFDLYGHFDVLASVSPALSEVNRKSMLRLTAGGSSKFVAVMNQIDPAGVRKGALEPLDDDLAPWFAAEVPTVLAMGRLSLEKDQAKLVRAMAEIREKGYKANLVLLGDGPMRQDLEDLVRRLELAEQVFFAGHRANPFPALRAADCFALSSNHEGQPMVLLESMILGTPIVATDIPGSRQVLSENVECLVDNSVEGLSMGIIDVLAGRRKNAVTFDAESYWVKTREAFIDVTK